MSTIAAQCLLVALLVDEGVELPRLWRHAAEGALTWRFAGTSNDFTWQAEAVEDCAARWRRLRREPPSEVAAFVLAHDRLLAICDGAGRSAPDVVVHDLGDREVTAMWRDERVVVVVDHVGEPSPGQPSVV